MDTTLATKLARMVGLRNVIVHAYVDIDLAVVEGVLLHNLGDLEAFVAAVRTYLARA